MKSSLIDWLKSNYKNNHYFVLDKNQKLSKECNAPEKQGIYCIFKVCKSEEQLVYIGASGTMSQNGDFQNQSLCGRIKKGKQDGMSRREYFAGKFNTDDIEKLEIHWFITYDETLNLNHLPKYVEGVLLQKYFELNGCLPPWNKKF